MLLVNIKLHLIEEALGTCPGDKEIFESFIASKAPDSASLEEEISAYGADVVAQKGMTLFMKDENGPFVWNYIIRGFLKSAAGFCKQATGSKTSRAKLTAHKKRVDGGIFIPQSQRRLYWMNPDGSNVTEEQMGTCQRPLRADTAQGPRVSLAASETIPAGSCLEFRLYVLDESLEPLVEEWFRYGCLNGLCQWRNSGKGAFVLDEFTTEERGFLDFLPGDYI